MKRAVHRLGASCMTCRHFLLRLLTLLVAGSLYPLASSADSLSAAHAEGASAGSGQPAGARAPLVLSAEEKSWLAAHPILRVAATSDWPPFEYVDADGVYKGISADLLRLLGEHVGFEIEIVTGKWTELFDMLKAGELDVCPGLATTPQRKRSLLFTKPLLDFPHAIYVREGENQITSLDDLKDRVVVVEKDYWTHEVLEKDCPEIKLVPVDSSLQALLKVSDGEADAYIGNTAVSSYLIDRNVIMGLKSIWCPEVASLKLSIGVRKDFGPLVAILNRAIDALGAAEKRDIIARYTVVPHWVNLSDEEWAWIRAHPAIRLGVDPEFAPFEFVAEDGSYEGMASDYVRLLNQRLGLNMKVVHKTSWLEAVDLASTRDLDVLPCVGITQQRRKLFLFTRPYLSFYRVIVTKRDGPLVSTIDDLSGLRVAVQADTSHHGFLVEQAHIAPLLFDSVETTLMAVSRGKADAAVGNVATVSYWIRKLGLTDLRITVPADRNVSHLHFAVRSDWPELVVILNKGLASITEEEANTIRKKWVGVSVEPGIDVGRIVRVVAGVVAVALLFLGLLGLHNRRLRKEIRVRKHAEEARRRSEEDYRTLVESANSVILRMTPEGTVVFINAFAERFFGYTPEELVGRNVVGTIVPEADAKGLSLRALMADLASYPDKYEVNENENMTKSGDHVWVAWTNCPLYDEEGSLKEVLCVGADMTARKRAEEVLFRYEFIVNTVDDMMSVLSAEGCYEAINTAWCSAMGMAREAVVGKRLSEVWPAEVAGDNIWPNLRRCLSGDLVTQESVVQLPNRGERHCEVTMYPYADANGDITHAVVVTHDVTDWRNAQAALREAKQAAEAANLAKSAFLANMSHEIRTPMNAILGYTQLLQRYADLSPDQQHALDAIARSGDHLLALINDVLEMSRIEAGRVQLRPATFNMRGLLSDMEVMFRVRTNTKGLELTTEVEESVPTFIRADEGRVRQVLVNLLGNAVKFTDHGRISVQVGLDPNASQTGCALAIEVADTGYGIQPEELDSIFESFEQAGSAALRRGGTGLGLSISRSFARMMGGDITVTSELGVGSRFLFTMLAEAGAETDAKSRAPERYVKHVSPGQKEIRVLIVDDRATNRDLLCRLLEKVGFVTREAENGAEGLTAFNDWHPAIVLIDLVMPVMNGWEAIRKMRLSPEGQKATIIAVTASALEEGQGKALSEGADALLRKPFRDNELFELIRRHADVAFDYEEGRTAPTEGPTDTSLKLAAQALEVFPADVRKRLRHAVVTGSIDNACSIAGEVRDRAPELAALIERCAREFALHEIEELLDTGGDEV